MRPMARVSIKEQMQRVREDAIVDAVNQLLAAKGYELMTVDEVAAEAGLAKASLYKLFTSKEELAAAAMVRVLERALAQAAALAADEPAAGPRERLEAMVRWTLEVQLAGQMPTLPAQNSRLVAALKSHRAYMDRLFELSDLLGGWIVEAQAAGTLNRELPSEMVLFTMFARACDPVLGMLKASGKYEDGQLVELLLTTTFRGIGP
jgi:TetR/AcrR family transcriptional regulator of autoinduction and epiphytic fitness